MRDERCEKLYLLENMDNIMIGNHAIKYNAITDRLNSYFLKAVPEFHRISGKIPEDQISVLIQMKIDLVGQ